MSDYYEILGVDKNASKDEIKIIINAELQYEESIENFDI